MRRTIFAAVVAALSTPAAHAVDNKPIDLFAPDAKQRLEERAQRGLNFDSLPDAPATKALALDDLPDIIDCRPGGTFVGIPIKCADQYVRTEAGEFTLQDLIRAKILQNARERLEAAEESASFWNDPPLWLLILFPVVAGAVGLTVAALFLGWLIRIGRWAAGL